MRYVVIFCLLHFLGFLGCSDSPGRKTTIAFYHWKNKLDVSDFETSYLQQLEVQKLYVKFFDVDWQDGRAQPLSILETKGSIPEQIEIIPTVFITNRTLSNTPDHQIEGLAGKILKKIDQLIADYPINEIHELQFDCDWSQNTRKKYFTLLDFMKSRLEKRGQLLSVTIRLHQIKFFERTGVPRVDRGVLMFYNMGEVDELNTQNSILDLNIAQSYLHNFDRYPLPLDLALPIFKWGIVFQDEKMIRIINNLDESELQDSSRFLKIDKNRFRILKSTYLKGYYLYQNDLIRLEKVEPSQLTTTVELLKDQIKTQELNIIFYHLDSTLLRDYPYEVLQDISHRFN